MSGKLQTIFTCAFAVLTIWAFAYAGQQYYVADQSRIESSKVLFSTLEAPLLDYAKSLQSKSGISTAVWNDGDRRATLSTFMSAGYSRGNDVLLLPWAEEYQAEINARATTIIGTISLLLFLACLLYRSREEEESFVPEAS